MKHNNRARNRVLSMVLTAGVMSPCAGLSATPTDFNDAWDGKAFLVSTILAQENDLDVKALHLMSNPEILRARQEGEKNLLATLPHATPASHARFKLAMDELTFFGVLNGLNDDPGHPRITVIGRPGRILGGEHTFATKGMDENPDSVYRIIPVDGASTYVLHGKAASGRPAVNEFSVLDDPWQTVGNLSSDALKLNADGSFAITIGPEPANGRPNYIQTTPSANYMTIRDTIADWAHQRPNQLTVERIAGPPAPALSENQQLQKAVVKVKRYFAETIKLHHLAQTQPANFFPQPVIRTTFGMLVTQAYSIGRFDLGKDKALVLTLHPGTAKYVTVPITNIWGTTMDPIHHSSSQNLVQSQKNPDGSFTVIVSATDPHLRNWVDTEGLSEGFIFLRWAAIEGGTEATSKPAVESKVVSLGDLAATVPTTLDKVDPAERKRQLQQRTTDYDLRWANN